MSHLTPHPPTQATALNPPLVTRDQLIGHLTEEGIVDPKRVASLLGEQRNSDTVNILELVLVKNNVIAKEELLERKGQLGGAPTFPAPNVSTTPQLPENVAARAGALVLNLPEPTVVMVEATPENVQLVAQTLNLSDFKIWLTTAAHFGELHNVTYRGGALEELEPTPDIYGLLDIGIARGASDIHIKVGVSPRLRIDGSMVALPFRRVDEQWMRRTIDLITPERNKEEMRTKLSTDYAYTFGTSRFRINAAHDTDGLTMVMRKLPTVLPTCEDLKLPLAIRNFAGLERGLVLVTGPTGSGKSTTLAALLNEVINTSRRHVITLEDPVEFTFPTDRKSLVNQRELGSSFATFPDGIRDALRQDPDVMLVGELRDKETISAALELADTGHLVFATLHTADAPSTVQRIVNIFPAEEQEAIRVQLSQLMRGCVSQTLLPRASGKGRIAAFEVLLNNPAVATNLRKVTGINALKQTMQTSTREGMQTMEASLARLAHAGVVTRPEAMFRAQNLDEFESQLSHLSKLGEAH